MLKKVRMVLLFFFLVDLLVLGAVFAAVAGSVSMGISSSVGGAEERAESESESAMAVAMGWGWR